MARPRSWSDTDLRAAVASSTSWSAVTRALALARGGSTIRLVRARAGQLGLETAHLTAAGQQHPEPVVRGDVQERRRQAARDRRSWTDAALQEAVVRARSWAEVHRLLGLTVGGRSYPMLRARAGELGLETAHFRDKGWRRGATTAPPGVRLPLADVLVEDSSYTKSHGLRLRLIAEGLKEARCEGCGGTEWRGAPMPLQLDHVNGRRSDNRLEKLRILCANCHAQTDTWCGRNKGR